jgi:hypothetical protein
MHHFNALLRKSFSLAVLVILASFSWSIRPGFAQSSPEDVAKALIAAEDSNNVDAAVANFADDAVVTLPTGVFDTPDAIRGWQQELADGHFRIEAIGITADGNTVSWTGEVSLDLFRSMGIASLGGNWVLDIENGKIETFDFSFTPDALNELQAGSAAVTLIAAESAHDVDAAVAAFSDDAVVTLPTGVFDTPDAIRGWQQELADGHFRIEPLGRHVHGNTISWMGDISLDLFRQMGIASMGGNWVLTAENGKVKTFDFTFTPDALNKLQAGSAAAALIAAESTHDVNAAVAAFADDAVVTLPTGVLDTPDAIRAWQQELADGHFRIEPLDVHVDGNTISWTGEISLDQFRSMGIASLGGNWVLTAENGKVKTFDFSWTPEAEQALQAAAKPS